MRKNCSVFVNDEKFTAKRGDILLDAALVNGVEVPHDCRSGHCGTCQVRILDGLAIGGECEADGMVRACQARVLTDLHVLVEPVPDAVATRGLVTGLAPIAPDIIEMRIHLAKPVTYLPGQYYKIQFHGFPPRCYSPAPPMSAVQDGGHAIRLHIRRVPGGRVSSALGVSINKGHHVRLQGPYGAAYLRPHQPNRLILISSSTGFAPIWSIAVAALQENPERRMMIIAGGRTIESLYMGPALGRLARFPNVLVVPVCSTPQTLTPVVKPGRPTDYLPRLLPTDVLYACGAPGMVDSIKSIAARIGAACYADPFLPTSDHTVEESVLSRAKGWLALPISQQMGQLVLDRRRQATGTADAGV
jgi:NAD(P)H-flavin reductase/ferredoxin